MRSISLPGAWRIGDPSYSLMRPDAVVYPGGGRREDTYDPLMRVKQILAKDPGGNSVLDYSYNYDTIGNILSRQTDTRRVQLHLRRPLAPDRCAGRCAGESNEGFDYDAVGNRIAQGGVEDAWSYHQNNELQTFAGTEYKYDENGNATQLLFDGAVMFSYHYNAQDRLVKVEDVNGSTITEYYYDLFGRRLWKDVQGTRTYFLYAGEGLIGEYDAAGNELTSYGYAPNATWTTNPLFLKHGDTYYFYQTDRLGTPVLLMKSNGAVVWSAHYQDFGEAVIEVSTITNNLRFPGQYYDEVTGLHYNWRRYYDPKLGRYLRPDPLGIKEGMNLYVYGKNNPLQRIDPDGQASRSCAAKWALSASQRSGIPVFRELGAYYSGRFGCAMVAIPVALETLRSVFPGYDPYSNGFNALHCYSNCLIASCPVVNGFSQSDFTQLMYANKVYEECTQKGEMCDQWCKGVGDHFQDYRDDVLSDFKADALGLCKGIELRGNFSKGNFSEEDCAAACMSQTESKGPKQNHQCDIEKGQKNKEKNLCCKASFERNPSFPPDLVGDTYGGLGDVTYDTMCPNIYDEFNVQ